jgi:hypothetical protein
MKVGPKNRLRSAGRRLQLSLVETRRVDGRVRHEHIASLGSIPASPSIADRIRFWSRLHERLAKLANRVVDPGKVLAVHAKISMPSIEEQRAVQLENAEIEAEQLSSFERIHYFIGVGRPQEGEGWYFVPSYAVQQFPITLTLHSTIK